MKTKQLLKTAFLMLMALLVINFTSNADAIQVKLPSGPCPPGSFPTNPPTCGGGYTLGDMGSFDAQGVWVWNAQFLETIDLAGFNTKSMFGPNWLTMITPVKTAAAPRITSGNLQRRHYAQGRDPEMRFVFQASGEGQLISYIPLYLRECFKTVTDSQTHEISTPCHSDSDVQRVDIFAQPSKDPNVPLYSTAPLSAGVAITMNDIQSVRWVEKNLIGSPWITDKQTYQMVNYDLAKRFWNQLSPNWQQSIDLHFKWTPIPALALDEVVTIEITLKNTSTIIPPLPSPVLIAKTKIRSLDSMPIIPGTITGTEYNILKEKEKKSGKIVIKAEEVQVTKNNITVREIDDPSGGQALVIQWPEPDIALFGGADMGVNTNYSLSVLVGAFPTAVDIYGTTEVFLVYDVPAQAGTCVVEGPSYEALLLKMEEKGFAKSDLRVFIRYSQIYNDFSFTQVPVTFKLTYQNRSLSPFVPINEN